MAKRLDAYDLETIVTALEQHYNITKETLTQPDGTIIFPQVLNAIDELGKEFHERASKANKGWGLSIISRWDNTRI